MSHPYNRVVEIRKQLEGLKSRHGCTPWGEDRFTDEVLKELMNLVDDLAREVQTLAHFDRDRD